jgi:hypothetical protein
MVYVLRLQKELIDLKKKYPKKYFINETTIKWFNNFLKVNKEIKISFILNDILLNIRIIIDDNYPFHPPEIYINSFKYIKLLVISPFFLDPILDHCLCCNSILSDWVAYYKIIDILEEIEKNLIIKKRVLESFLCKKIIAKYLIKDLNIILDFL